MNKSVERTQWASLYEVIARLAELEPWKYFTMDDPVVIRRRGEALPELAVFTHNGLVIYHGNEGLEDYDVYLYPEDYGISSEYAQLNQTCLICAWGNQEEVPKENLAAIHDLGLTFHGKGNWVFFASYHKRYYPTDLDRDEAEYLIDVLGNLYLSVKAVVDGGMTKALQESQIVWRTWDEATEQWLTYFGPRLEVDHAFFQVSMPQQELQTIRALPQTDRIVLLDCDYLGSQVKDEPGKRDTVPFAVLLMDEAQDSVLACELLNPAEPEAAKALRVLTKYAAENGRPAQVKVRNEWLRNGLQSVCQEMDIPLMLDELTCMDTFLEEMHTFL